MPITADTLRPAPGQTLVGLLMILGSVLLTACHRNSDADRSAAAAIVHARTCIAVGRGHEVVFPVGTAAAGNLRILVEERGISVIARLQGAANGFSASPVERFGTIVLLTTSSAAQSAAVEIRTADSPDVSGEVCVSAVLLSSSGAVAAAASFAAAGRAVQASDWETAFQAYLEAARRFDDLRSRRFAAAARHAMAELAYLRLDRKRDTLALSSEALGGYDSDADRIFIGLLTGLQAKALLDIPGSAAGAVATQARKLFATARRIDSADRFGARELPRLDIMSGFLEYRLDAPERAREIFTAAAQRCRQLGDWDCHAIASQNLALLAAESNNFTVALSAFADALRMLPEGLDPKLSADIWNNYGALQGMVGLLSSSERSHAIAMREYARLGDCPGVRRSLSRSGNLLVQIGTLRDAEHALQQAASLDCATLLTSVTDRSSLPDTAHPQGARQPTTDPHSISHTHDTACTHPLDTAGLATDNKIIVFNSLLSLGDALTLQGESALAGRCLGAAGRYATTARSQMRLANARGEALLESNKPARARESFEDSLRIADAAQIPPMHEYRGFARLGLVRSALLAGQAAETVRGASLALEASVKRGDIDQTVTALRLLAAGYRESQQFAKAAETLMAAVHLIEAVPIDELDGEKRATFLATQFTVFAELTDLYASQAAADATMISLAFSTSERGRSRSFRYALTQATRNSAAAVESPPVKRYQQLLREVVSLEGTRSGTGESRGDSADGQVRSGNQALVQGLDRVALHEGVKPEPLDQQPLLGTLNQLHATLVEYAVGAHDMYAFVVNGDGVQIIRLGNRLDIAAAAEQFLELVRDSETPVNEVRAAASRLASEVLWPLTEHLAGTRIIFVPDDALHSVPFSALPWSAGGSELMLNHADVSVVPSALFLSRIRELAPPGTGPERFALIGDPVFRVSDWRRECAGVGGTPAADSAVSGWTESLPRLPGSRAEVQMVARLAQQSRPTSRIEVLTSCAAVPAALQRVASGQLELLHIATHARVDAQRPRLSALALTPEKIGDATRSDFGLLDILDLKMRANLVVLSACETSRGRLLPGEGVLGPAQAFLQAGAAAVVATYWRIDDQTTRLLMQDFYHYLLTEHLPASTALRKAQLDQAARSSAHDWAAFALYGWPDSVL